MPSPWKKARLGGLSRLLVSKLRSKAKQGVGESPLVVQVGFPTSVADLVVKNRSRLKKPPRWLRHARVDGGDAAGCSTRAGLASEIVATAAPATTDRVPTPPQSPLPVPAEQQLLLSPVADGAKPRRSEVPEDVPYSPAACVSLAGLEARSPPGNPSAATSTAKYRNGQDLEAFVRGEVMADEVLCGLPGSKIPKNAVVQALPGSKIPKNEGSQAFPPGTKVPKLGVSNGFHIWKAAKNGVPPSFPGSRVEKDEFHHASPRSKAPGTKWRESSPREEMRKGEASGDFSVAEESEKKVPEGGSRKASVVAAKVVFPILALAVVSKKIAMVISILALAILFAESTGERLILLLRPRDEAKKNLGAIAGVASLSDLIQTLDKSNSHGSGRISTMYSEFGESDCCSFRSGGDWKVEEPLNATAPTVEMTVPALEEENLVGGSLGDQKSSPVNLKKKKLFGKLVPMKLRITKGGKGGKLEEKLELASDSGSTVAPCQKGTGGEALEADEEEDGECVDDEKKDGEEVLGFRIPAMAHDVDMENAPLMGENVGETVKGISGHLVFFLIVLSGLTRGRIVALALTVSWYGLVWSARSLWRRQISHGSLHVVSDASTSEA